MRRLRENHSYPGERDGSVAACWLLLLASFSFLVSGCGQEEGSQHGPGQPSGRPGTSAENEEPEATAVRTTPAIRGSVSRELTATAVVESEHHVEAVSRAQGIVQKIFVEEGDTVIVERERLSEAPSAELPELPGDGSAGTTLAMVEGDIARIYRRQDDGSWLETRHTILAQLEVDQQRKLRDKARTRFEKLAAEWRGKQRLHQSSLISEDEFQSLTYQLREARLEWELEELTLANLTLITPIPGVVSERHIQQGELITQGESAFSIYDPASIQVQVHVPEREFSHLAAGKPALCQSDSFPGVTFPGEVLRVAPVIDAKTGTARVTIQLHEAPASGESRASLRPGMFVTVRIILEERPEAILVPKRALLHEENLPCVMIFEDGVAHKRSIKTGFSRPDEIEVLDGVEEGEEVIVVGQHGLPDGARVRQVD